MPQQAVLTPEFGKRLQSACTQLEPRFRLAQARIGPREVDARICRSDGTCVEVHFSIRGLECSGTVTGDWCLTLPAGTPTDLAELPGVLASLAPDGAVDFEPPRQPGDPWPAFTALGVVAVFPILVAFLWRKSRPWAWLSLLLAGSILPGLYLSTLGDSTLSLRGSAAEAEAVLFRAEQSCPSASLAVWLLIPLALGVYIAACVRWANQGRMVSGLALLLTGVSGPSLGAAAALISGRLGGWDSLSMGLLFSLTALLVGHQWCARRKLVALSVSGGLLSLLLCEALLRLLMPEPPAVAAREVRILQPLSIRPDGVPATSTGVLMHAALYGVLGVETQAVLRFGRPPISGPWVLHLGDSMVFGAGVTPEEALPGRLAQLWPGPEQVNAGVPATSLDVQLALAWRLLRPNPPALVVLHVMPGNDLEDLDQPNEACLDQPTLIMDSAPMLRCPAPQWAVRSVFDRLLRSRPPLPLTQLNDVSWLARLAETASQRLVMRHTPRSADLDTSTAHYLRLVEELQRACAAVNAPVVAVVWPLRPLVYRQSAGPKRHALLHTLAKAKLDFVDLQPLVDEWVAYGGEDHVYLSATPGDIHLNRDAIDRIAHKLLPLLQTHWNQSASRVRHDPVTLPRAQE